ncbi:MAG TPA: VOC family protein [Candidatus Limnocylindria bacterium]|nr:VOC family protein [Candidatus Limnocylindria bacterium]
MLANNTMYAALPVLDIAQAMDFYGKTLGLTIVDQNENGVWYQTGTSRIVLYYSEFAGTNGGTAAIWEVGDPRSTVRSLQARGVQFEKYTLPGARRRGYIHHFARYDAAWFKDPSGNLICITHHL